MRGGSYSPRAIDYLMPRNATGAGKLQGHSLLDHSKPGTVAAVVFWGLSRNQGLLHDRRLTAGRGGFNAL